MFELASFPGLPHFCSLVCIDINAQKLLFSFCVLLSMYVNLKLKNGVGLGMRLYLNFLNIWNVHVSSAFHQWSDSEFLDCLYMWSPPTRPMILLSMECTTPHQHNGTCPVSVHCMVLIPLLFMIPFSNSVRSVHPAARPGWRQELCDI